MQDQTEDAWLKWLVRLQPYALGTGILLIQNPTLGNPRATQKRFLENITYETCKKRGIENGAIVIKWIPHTVASYEALLATNCGEYCVERCSKPGCCCNPDTHICE
jgi:hypothetical protein